MPVFRLTNELVFPPPEFAEDGLLAVGGDLGVERLLLAYRNGIFPWYSADEPILWWSPDPRLVLFPAEFHVARRFQRTIKQGTYRVTMDTAFEQVIQECAAAPRNGDPGTWITQAMQRAYVALHRAGYAHSVECWRDGGLAGGLYGVSLGACFFGESMFSRSSNASKVALAALVGQLQRWDIGLIDCQVETEHLRRMGAREMPRARFLRLLRRALRAETRRGSWRLEPPGGAP